MIISTATSLYSMAFANKLPIDDTKRLCLSRVKERVKRTKERLKGFPVCSAEIASVRCDRHRPVPEEGLPPGDRKLQGEGREVRAGDAEGRAEEDRRDFSLVG